MTKKILLIGMLNSIHFANWVERVQFIDRDIYLYPSRQYKSVHPKLAEILQVNKSVKIVSLIPNVGLSTYLEFLLDTKWFRWARYFSREHRLARVLKKFHFCRIHAIEIQHAAYLLHQALPSKKTFNNIVVTNWGSDIYFYSNFPEHEERIRDSLAMANYYSAECMRDYDLARSFGFTGVDLPLVPNSTTFPEEHFKQSFLKPNQRYQIIMKCYGGTFGYGEILLEIANDFLLEHKELNVYAYSVTEELVQQAEKVKSMFGDRFRYTTVSSPVSHEKILHEFALSRIYVGASKSDGISTSFLEALGTGAFPIQTSTSCAGEWVDSGAYAGIIQPSKLAIEAKLSEVIENFALLDSAQQKNLEVAKKRLSYDVIAKITQDFYV
jgi:glycosyltransferase involved in cell wall biosynthesis